MVRGKYIRTETIRKKTSESMKGKLHTEETKRKIGAGNRGKHRSDETREKISEYNKGKELSDETKKKMSDAKIGKYTGENHHMFGKHLSEEHKKKIGDGNIGKNVGEKSPFYGKFGKEHPRYKEVVNVCQLHYRVRRVKLIPEVCDICHQKVDKYGKTKLVLSNMQNHQYTDNPDDYQYVHHSCHLKYDIEKRKQNEKL